MKTNSSTDEIKTWTTSQVVMATIFVVCVFLTFWLVYRVRLVVFLLFTAIVIGTAIRPGVEWFRERGILRPLGVIFVYIILSGLLIGFLAMVVPLIADQVSQLYQHAPVYYLDFREWLLGSSNRLLHNLGLRVPSELAFPTNDGQSPQQMFDRVTQTFLYANRILKGSLETIAVFLLAYYWTQESNLIIKTVLRFVPPGRRPGVRSFLHLAEEKMGGYVRGQGLLCLAVGIGAFISYVLIGLPYALVLGIMAGLAEMIPIFGPVLGAIPAVLVGLSVDPTKVVWILVAMGVIQLVENAWLVPHIMRNSMGVNPIIIILSLVAFSSVFGFLGAVLALPLAAIIQLVIDRIVLAPNGGNGGVQSKELDIQSLISESHELLQSLEGSPPNGSSSPQKAPQPAGAEIRAITLELDELLVRIKNEDKFT
jgi:predicted PurR-regulated permease PerM